MLRIKILMHSNIYAKYTQRDSSMQETLLLLGYLFFTLCA